MGNYSEDVFQRLQSDVIRNPGDFLAPHMEEPPDSDDEAFSLGCMRLTMVDTQHVNEL